MVRVGGMVVLLVFGALPIGGTLASQESETSQGGGAKGLVGSKFASDKDYQIGALPTGPVQGKRTVHFQEKGNFTYVISDAIEVGTFSWNSKTGAIQGKGLSGKVYQGKYDEKTRKLSWDGAKYTLIDPVKNKDKK